MRTRALGLTTLMCASLVLPGVANAAAPGHGPVFPPLAGDLEAHYDFDHPVPGDPSREADQGSSGTTLDLVNGGADMRVPDGAHGGSRYSIQTKQIDPTSEGNNDWKAGIFSADGVPTLDAFSDTTGTTVMGWFKVTGDTHPAPDTTTPDPDDHFNAVGLAGVLSGDSAGHGVRALLELIEVDGELRLVALGRRVDGSSSSTFAAKEDWRELLPRNEWVFLAATFDYDDGTMALYRNGKPVPGFYTGSGDPWNVEGEPEPDRASDTNPNGIKVGASFPQNNRERNPCNCRFDSLMFFDRSLSANDVQQQYRWARRR